MHLGHALLVGRIIGLGIERPLVKRMGLGHNPFAVTVLWTGFGGLMFTVLMLIRWGGNPEYFAGMADWLPMAVIPALLYGTSFNAYVHAMKVGEVSLLTPLFASGFVLMYVYDVIYGWAELHWLPLVGVLLVTLGVALLNLKPGMGWQRLFMPLELLKQPGAFLMLLCAFAVATGRMMDRRIIAEADPMLYATVIHFGPVGIGLLLLALQRKLPDLPKYVREGWKMCLACAFLGHGAFLLMLLMMANYEMPASVIEPVSQLGVFIAVALGGLWFNEPIRTRWLPSAMVVAGAAMLLV